jgi:acetoin utilization protein AcuB
MKTASIARIMTKDVVCVSPDQKILDIKHIYEKRDFHHHIPVTKDGQLVGIISLVDFMYRIQGAGLDDSDSVYTQLSAGDIMTANPVTLGPDADIEDAAKILATGRYRALPIVKDKSIVGIVTTADIIRFYLDK